MKSYRVKNFFKILLVVLMAFAIPGLLVLNAVNSRKTKELQDEVVRLEQYQKKLIEDNQKKITDISMLSSSDRIEKIAEEELQMRKAESEEIVRVEMKGKDKK